MATLAQIHALMTNTEMLGKCAAAVTIAAEVARDTPPVGVTPEVTRKWVAQVNFNPTGEAQKAWRIMLGADGAAFTEAQILGLTDAALQSRVNAVVLDMIRMFNQL